MPSKSRDTRRWLLDIQHHIRLAQRFVGDAPFEHFRDDLQAFYAATRCLEIISEASRRLPAELKAQYPSIPWDRMAAAGNVYRHDYEDVEQKLVWEAIRHRLPELPVIVEQELGGSIEHPGH